MLTGRWLSRGLLEALCQGGAGEGGVGGNDGRSAGLLETLREIGCLYGDAFLLLHYSPFAVTTMRAAARRFGARHEGALLGALSILQAFFPAFSDKQLMDNLQEVLVDDILFPAVRLLCSLRILFHNARLRFLFTFTHPHRLGRPCRKHQCRIRNG